jgi:hypothetical protein
MAVIATVMAWAGTRGIAKMHCRLRFQHPLYNPLGQVFQQPVLTQNIAWIGIVFQQFVSQGFLCCVPTGHLALLLLSVKITS